MCTTAHLLHNVGATLLKRPKHTTYARARVCVCVCVCVWERERVTRTITLCLQRPVERHYFGLLHHKIAVWRLHNSLNAELHPICHLLAWVRAHHILYVSRVRVNMLYIENLSSYLTQNGVSIRKTKRLMLFGETIVNANTLRTHSWIALGEHGGTSSAWVNGRVQL